MHRDSKFTSTLVTILALGALPMVGCKKPAPEGASPVALTAESAAPVRVTVAAAQARQVPDVLSATGTLVADQQSALTPIVPGRVMAVMIERGQRVTEGQPLLRVRDTDYRTQAVSAQAAVAQARARLGLDQPGAGTFRAEETAEVRAAAAQRDMADDGLRRAEQLHRSGAMSDADYQRATMQATAAREQHRAALNGVRGAYYGYQQAREALSAAQRAVADSIVRAPFAGEIAERMCNVGEYVSPQRAILTLVRTDPLRLELQVPQERIAGVRQGQAVEVRVDAFPERVFRGTVQYISAAVRPDSRSLVAEAVVPNTEASSGRACSRRGASTSARVAPRWSFPPAPS
jgi:membrane fusion protein (multidrug efflux system)